jgi:four helix bundle protein
MPTVKQPSTAKSAKVYDLEERAGLFGESVIRLALAVPKDLVNSPVIAQLVRAATSVGANYMEAREAESGKDYRHKVAIAKKEAHESMHWLRMLAVAHPPGCQTCRELWQEAHELALIFSAIIRSAGKS